MRPRFYKFLLLIIVAAFIAPAIWVSAISADNSVTSAPRPLEQPSFVVASLNFAKETNADTIVRELRSAVGVRDASVLLAQEIVRDAESQPSVAEVVAAKLGWHVTFAAPHEGKTVSGLALLSRTPLRDVRVRQLKRENLIIRSRKRIAIAATADTTLGPVRIVNAHLDTRINPGERLEQLGPAIDEAVQFQGPAVVGGDWNTNDMQWVSNIVPVPFPGWQASRVRILMQSRGFQTPFQTRRATFDHMGMQLDWLYTNRLHEVSSGIEPIQFSDHHAVWVQYTVRP
jgi:endonuclease/exonuclease/phosphatase family metal-dependent hydrolase